MPSTGRALRAQEHNQTAFSRDDPQPCDICQMPAVAISPGSEPVHELFLLARGVPRRQWCLAHWPAAQNPCALSSNSAQRP